MDRLRPHLLLWQQRFDVRAPRERLVLTVASIAFALMLADALWLGGALKSWQVATRRVQSGQQALDTHQTDGARVRATGDAQSQQLQIELNTWRQRVREGDAGLRSYEDRLVGPERILVVLEQMLARHGQVRVRAMQSLGRNDLLDPAGSEVSAIAPKGAPAAGPTEARPARAHGATRAATAASTPAATAASPSVASAGATATAGVTTPSLYRHGVELTLEGSFADLLSYLRTLEAMPQRLLWGGVDLRVEHYPKSVLKLRLYTVSRDRHWLEI